MRRLYLDCDDVLADFDKGATAILGMKPKAFEHRHGLGRFWQKLASAPDFYFSLPLVPDAMRLFDAVKHLDPIILTGLPRGNWAADQKMRWAAKHFPGVRGVAWMARGRRGKRAAAAAMRWAAKHFPGVRRIPCRARDKRDHAKEGDVLVDDNSKYRHLWEQAGGIFVHHKNAAQAIEELRAYFEVRGA